MRAEEAYICVQRMHIQVMAPKVEAKLTNQPKTVDKVKVCLQHEQEQDSAPR